MDKKTLKSYMEATYLRCYRVLRDREQALDATQEVMLKFYQKSSERELEQPLHYLYRSATNHCIDIMRRNDRLMPIENEALNRLLESHATRPDTRHKLLVDRLVKQFGEDDIKLFLHRHIEQMTYQEIASLYEMTDRGMKKKLDRIESQIRSYLGDQD